MITIFSEDHRRQHGRFELIDGKLMPPVEIPKRLDQIMERLTKVGLGEVIPPKNFGLAPILRVHTKAFVDFLQTAHDEWRKVHGDTDALPICWPSRTLRQIEPETIDGRLSYFSFDAGTPITAGTWTAITAAANVALSGAERVGSGEEAVFSLCRPPGHHASADMLGGYCFFNNAAIAAQSFLDNAAAKVAILDVDYHHGNGTQAIFYDRDDVMYASLHAHPAQEYPFFLGYAEETGQGAGQGFNLNFPLRWGTLGAAYLAALDKALAAIADYAPDILVISLGVDTFEADPISKFKLKSADFTIMGGKIKQLGVPTLFVMEGGYAVETIGVNAVNVLTGFENA